MLTRGIRAGAVAARRVNLLRGLATQQPTQQIPNHNVIIDHTSGRVVKLTDPAEPEYGNYPYVFNPTLAQDKSPYKRYDDPQNRRNRDDPVNINDDLYDIWSPDYFQFVSDKTAVKHNVIFFSLVFGFGALIYYLQLNPEKPAMPRSYPKDGLAQLLGAGSDKDAAIYQARPDPEADATLKELPADPEIQAQTKAYLEKNKDFIAA